MRTTFIFLKFMACFIFVSQTQAQSAEGETIPNHQNQPLPPQKEGKDKEVWYAYSMSGDLMSCTVYDDKMVFNSLVGSENEKGISVVILEKRLDSLHLVIRNDKKTPPYAVMSLRKNGEVLKMAPVLTGTSISDVEKRFKEGLMPSWISLTEQDWYTKEKIAMMEKAPGLDELKREDLLTSLRWRDQLSEKLQQYLEEKGAERPFMIYRFVEAYRNQKLVELGYNPYKRVPYNLHKQFENDEEIMRLLTEEIKF